MPNVGRRVVDLVSGDVGTVTDWSASMRRYLVAWDDPTPHQDRAWVSIPSEFFDWLPTTDVDDG